MVAEMTPKQRAEEAARVIAKLYKQVVHLEVDDFAPIIERALLAQRAEHEAERCHHGWRGSVPDGGRQIATPCPACGARSLFIGSGGHLTCASVPSDTGNGCPSPAVEETVAQLKRRAELTETTRDATVAEARELAQTVLQSFSEINHAHYNPRWFTKGREGADGHFRLWLDRGVIAAKAMLADAKEQT